MLAGHSLQKWKLSTNEPPQLILITELNRMVRERFYSSVWESCPGDRMDRLASLMSEADTWLLDIECDKDNVFVLAAAVHLQVSPQIHYALMVLQIDNKETSAVLKEFAVININGFYREDNPMEALAYRFFISNNCAYLYNKKSVTVIKPHEEPDTLEFNSPHDFLLGGFYYC